ncbi:GLPGLI family protein [Mucilaginibacter sp. UYNi724]
MAAVLLYILMKKFVPKYYLIFVIALCSSFKETFAQTWSGKITYKFVLNLDTAVREIDTVGKESLLYFNQEQSYFVYRSSLLNSDNKFSPFTMPKPNPKALTTEKVQRGTITLPPHTDLTGEVFYTDFVKRQLYMREFVFSRPLMSEENLPRISWKITKDKKDIGKLNCIKAICNFRGRNYEAWFCEEIPVSAGPWKLQGLPGLIIEANDSTKQVRFLFQSVEIPLIQQPVIPPLSEAKGKRIPLDEYRNAWDVQGKKVAKFMQSSGNNGIQTEVNSNYHPIETVFENK